MTTTWAGGTSLSEYDARIRRAERLSAQHSFASEFLNFYKHIGAFQKTLRAGIAAAAGTKSSNISVAELRVPLDLSVLPSDSWIASLESYWQHGGKYDQQVGAFAQFLPRAFLQPYAEFRAALLPQAPMVITVRVCPLCGARPLLGVLRVEGDSGKRFLLCSFCSQ